MAAAAKRWKSSANSPSRISKSAQVRLSNAASHRPRSTATSRRAPSAATHIQAKTGVQRGEPVDIEEPITVKILSAALGIKSNDIISKLMKQGVFATINQTLDRETAETIALEYGVELQIAQQATLEEELLAEFESRERDPENLVPARRW